MEPVWDPTVETSSSGHWPLAIISLGIGSYFPICTYIEPFGTERLKQNLENHYAMYYSDLF